MTTSEERDQVDMLMDQWSNERPELDADDLGVVVRIQLLAKLLGRSAENALRGLELQLWEYDVLSALRRQGDPFQLPATELARESMLSTGAITNRIDNLEMRLLVRRDPDPDDGRSVLVTLTQQGRELIDQATATRLASANEHLSALTKPERQVLAARLRKVLLSLDKLRDEVL
jgi:DNA-binding MarR family transcriptional regulator